MDLLTLAAVALLVAGVVGSAVPFAPGAPLSLAGVYLQWWHTGYTDPGPLPLVAFTLVGVLAVAVDHFGGAVSARAGGASTRSVVAAAAVGLALLVFLGPLGMLVGVPGTVFVLELRRRGGDLGGGARAAVYAAVGILGSVLVQVLLTGSMLAAFLLLVL